jgi:Leucine-rich repeat (LRR) protein
MTTILDPRIVDDIFYVIFTFLGPASMCNLHKTCNKFRVLVNSTIKHINASQDMASTDIKCFPNVDSMSFETCTNINQFTMLKHINCSYVIFPEKTLQPISSLSLLRELELSYAHFSDRGMAPLAALTSLTSLNLYNCKQLTGDGFKYLTPLSQLQYLNISDCKIQEYGFHKIGKLTSLQTLVCSFSKHMSTVCVGYLSNLKKLVTFEAQLIKKPIDLSRISQMESIQVLDLGHSKRLFNTNPTSWSKLSALKEIRLQETIISEDVLFGISHLSSLEELYLDSCNGLTDDGLMHLAQISTLKTLSLAFCNDITEVGLKHLTNLVTLMEVDIDGCLISVEQVENMRRLMPNVCIVFTVEEEETEEDLEYFHVATRFWEDNN